MHGEENLKLIHFISPIYLIQGIFPKIIFRSQDLQKGTDFLIHSKANLNSEYSLHLCLEEWLTFSLGLLLLKYNN